MSIQFLTAVFRYRWPPQHLHKPTDFPCSVTQRSSSKYQILYSSTQFLNPHMQTSQSIHEKLLISHTVKKFSASSGTKRFITKFATDYNLSLSWDKSIQPTPSHPISFRSLYVASTRNCKKWLLALSRLSSYQHEQPASHWQIFM